MFREWPGFDPTSFLLFVSYPDRDRKRDPGNTVVQCPQKYMIKNLASESVKRSTQK